MRVLSATDAIEPAWTHARRVTFGPRRWGLAFKIAAVAFFARLGGCNSHFNNSAGHAHGLPPAMHAALQGVFVLVALVGLVIALVFLYVRSRLQFVLFDMVLRNDTTVVPIWRRFGRATWHWIGLKLAFFVVALACVSPVVVPIVIQFVHTVRETHGHPNPGWVMANFFSIFATLFLVLIVIGVGYNLLIDFGLPSMALEGTPMGMTVSRVWTLLRTDTAQVLLYLVLRFVLGIAASIGCVVAVLGTAAAAAIPLGGAALATWMGLRHAALNGHILMVALLVLLGVLYAVLLAIAFISFFGYAQVFFQAYSLFFLAGRYPLLASYLERSLPPEPAMYAYPPPMPEAPPQV